MALSGFDFLFYEMQFFKPKVVRDTARLGPVQLQQAGNQRSANVLRGLRSLMQHSTDHLDPGLRYRV